jgi:hypothetical protein
MNDGNFWFDQFRSMVNIVNTLRNDNSDLKRRLEGMQTRVVEQPVIQCDKIVMIKKVRDLCRQSSIDYDNESGLEVVCPPSLGDLKKGVEDIIKNHIRIVMEKS